MIREGSKALPQGTIPVYPRQPGYMAAMANSIVLAVLLNIHVHIRGSYKEERPGISSPNQRRSSQRHSLPLRIFFKPKEISTVATT